MAHNKKKKTIAESLEESGGQIGFEDEEPMSDTTLGSEDRKKAKEEFVKGFKKKLGRKKG